MISPQKLHRIFWVPNYISATLIPRGHTHNCMNVTCHTLSIKLPIIVPQCFLVTQWINCSEVGTVIAGSLWSLFQRYPLTSNSKIVYKSVCDCKYLDLQMNALLSFHTKKNDITFKPTKLLCISWEKSYV